MNDEFVATLTKHQHGVIYISCEHEDTIDSLKTRLKNWLQPKGIAFYGGKKNFSGGKGFSIPTKEFELCLEAFFPNPRLQVLLSCFSFFQTS